ncbi:MULTISPECIES: hypothetical protein [Halorussus]|uniref:hypothetical protein n=1 Tax=Halorussus TaxID=1070314 RepID=UPI0020A03091|nr:hypothetical protein [Halorussus vallis]USZ76672.1 hypothetical protein NGM07_04925 [Halorussus vallis]
MDAVSKVLLYALVGVTVFFGGLLLFASGPVGWLVAGLVVVAWIVRSSGEREDEAVPRKTNCPECGVPNEDERNRCEYCDAALP